MTKPTALDLLPHERDAIRREFMELFGGSRSISEGLLCRRWATGEHKGQVKVSKAVQTMLDRGLVFIEDDPKRLPVARFTDTGILALRHFVDAGRLDRSSHAAFIDEVIALTADRAA